MLEGASEMGDLFVHRFQFAFTVVYHYLFPQLTMGRSCRSMRDSPVHRPRRANTVMVNQYSTIVTLGVARARQVRVALAASSRGPFDPRGV